MIEFKDDDKLSFVNEGRNYNVYLDDIPNLINPDEQLTRIEVVLWGLIAATREQTRTLKELCERPQIEGPSMESLIAEAMRKFPDLMAVFGGGAAADHAVFGLDSEGNIVQETESS